MIIKIFEDIRMSELIQNFLIPVGVNLASQYLISNYLSCSQQIGNRFKECDIISENDLIQEPTKQVVINTLEELSKIDDKHVQNCYLKLLKTAYDRNTKDLAHPSYTQILSQLSRDEAWILYYIKDESKNVFEMRTYDFNKEIVYYQINTNDFENSAITYKHDKFKLYHSNLVHLNLIKKPENDTDYHILFDKHSHFQQKYISKDEECPKASGEQGSTESGKIGKVQRSGEGAGFKFELTARGNLFAQACIPNDIDIEQFDNLRKYRPQS